MRLGHDAIDDGTEDQLSLAALVAPSKDESALAKAKTTESMRPKQAPRSLPGGLVVAGCGHAA
jgi:hypothetical protein